MSGRGGLCTIKRAENVGVVAGLAALLLWALRGSWPALLYPFAAALAVTAFAGVSILWICATDAARGPKRGRLLRAIRVFDLVLGAVLAIPALYALSGLWREL